MNETPKALPKMWSDLKPPGYWAADGRFVPVREMTQAEIDEAREQWLDWFGWVPDCLRG